MFLGHAQVERLSKLIEAPPEELGTDGGAAAAGGGSAAAAGAAAAGSSTSGSLRLDIINSTVKTCSKALL